MLAGGSVGAGLRILCELWCRRALEMIHCKGTKAYHNVAQGDIGSP